MAAGEEALNPVKPLELQGEVDPLEEVVAMVEAMGVEMVIDLAVEVTKTIIMIEALETTIVVNSQVDTVEEGGDRTVEEILLNSEKLHLVSRIV